MTFSEYVWPIRVCLKLMKVIKPTIGDEQVKQDPEQNNTSQNRNGTFKETNYHPQTSLRCDI